MKKVHVHVYSVRGLKEYDFDDLTELEAREKALAEAQLPDSHATGSGFGEPDCRYIAIAFTKEE